MNNFQKSKAAKDYYLSCCPKKLFTGFEKYVATDGIDSLFVNSEYDPETSDIAVFYLRTINKTILCQLYKPTNIIGDGKN